MDVLSLKCIKNWAGFNLGNQKIYFLGPIINVDSTIEFLNDVLDNGFEVRQFSDDECNRFHNYPELFSNELMGCWSSGTTNIFFIYSSVSPNTYIEPEMDYVALTRESIFEFEDLYNKYLNPLIRLLKLFKEGNIQIPFRYYFYKDKDSKFLAKCNYLAPILDHEKYRIERKEIPVLKKFIETVKLPLKDDNLELAFENFELSYEVSNLNLKFLSLMNGMEVLFNPSDQELRYRISRNLAVLLGKDKEESQDYFKQMRKLYDKRSKIVHTGKAEINQDDVLKLRGYVRDSIKAFLILNMSKDDILPLLNSSGFGENLIENFNNRLKK
jgi:hypothetical protein